MCWSLEAYMDAGDRNNMKYSLCVCEGKGRCLLFTAYFFSGMLCMWIMRTADDVHIILLHVCCNSYYLDYYLFYIEIITCDLEYCTILTEILFSVQDQLLHVACMHQAQEPTQHNYIVQNEHERKQPQTNNMGLSFLVSMQIG